MKSKIFLFFALLLSANLLKAQTLFTYGTHAVTKAEFLEAFNKNPDTTGTRSEKLKEYLNLYENFKLKLQAAYDEKANTNAELKSETDNFKAQLTENYINQQADINQLMHEAFLRSQKDILLQEVFVKIDGVDTAAAFAQISKAYEALKSGKNFDEVTVQYSSDTSVQQAKGNIGYITAFTLPYSIENLVYNLKPGGYSTIYKSNIGYHIFKNAGERDALGKRKIEQLLFVTPEFLNNHQKDSVTHIADSVYTLLQKGTSFSMFLPVYGHNYYDNGSNAIEVSVGSYSPDFEQSVFSLKNKDEVSKPFKTQYGYNIIKLDEIEPVAKDENDINFTSGLQAQIQNDGRLNTAKTTLVEKWLTTTGFKEEKYNQQDLWKYTDSALKKEDLLPALYKGIKPETVLFHFSKKNILVKDWIDYLRAGNVTAVGVQQRDYAKNMHDFIRVACDNYYRSHIEEYDTAAAEQIKEFNEANMLFYVMDKHVWSKASNDSIGLKQYYEDHKSDYKWKESLSALVISAPEKVVADSIADKIKNNASNWRSIVSEYGSSIYADSSRFEVDQLPVKQKVIMQKDFQSVPEANENGDSYTFIHILNIYPEAGLRSFEEAKGLVINDYQQKLENDWLAALKKTYIIKVNTTVFNTLH